jgi:hypothetical protein
MSDHTTSTLEEANAALRNAVETRLAGTTTAEMSPMVASLAGCKPAMEAATRALSDAEPYSEWTPPDYARREEAVKGWKRLIEETRPAREARTVHPTSQAFFDLCDQMKDMHRRKSSDYGCPSGTDPLANIRNGAKFVGIPAWKGAMVRLSDKVTRLTAYNATGRLENESLDDTLFDLASYSLLALLLHRESRDAAS